MLTGISRMKASEVVWYPLPKSNFGSKLIRMKFKERIWWVKLERKRVLVS